MPAPSQTVPPLSSPSLAAPADPASAAAPTGPASAANCSAPTTSAAAPLFFFIALVSAVSVAWTTGESALVAVWIVLALQIGFGMGLPLLALLRPLPRIPVQGIADGIKARGVDAADAAATEALEAMGANGVKGAERDGIKSDAAISLDILDLDLPIRSQNPHSEAAAGNGTAAARASISGDGERHATPMKITATRDEIRRAAGHALIIGFEGTTLTPELRELMRETRPRGLILFSRNIESPTQCAELIRELKTTYGDQELLLCVDQEGGRVARVASPATPWPAMRVVGTAGDPALTRGVGVALGREMRAIGFDVTFAPVLDLDSNPDNPVIGDRSFASSPEAVSKHGVAFLKGLEMAGISGCGKHFPGHGDTDTDSHLALPIIEHELRRLQQVEWQPFAAAIAAGAPALMTAHVVVSCLDEALPATLCGAVLDRLRTELGFGGVLVSDDIDMKAVADNFNPNQIATLGLNAGVDVFLACKDPARIMDLYRAIVVGAESQEISHRTLLACEARTTAWARKYYRGPTSDPNALAVVGCAEHIELCEEIGARL